MRAVVADALRPYLAVLTARFRMLLQYRAAAFAGFGTQLFWGAVRLMILGAFYASSQTESPMNLVQITAYVWLGQALLGLLPWNVDAELQEKMTTGAVAYELLRPLDLYTFWFARTVALRTATTFLRMIPMIVVAGLVLPLIGLGAWALPPPATAVNALCFVVSLTATVALASVITMLMHVALIWTLSGRGFNALMTGLVIALSGLVVPLPLYPDWMQPWLYWQPFRGLADVPFRIYSGNIVASAAVAEIFMQFCWAVLIGGIGYAILSRAQARIVVQGG
jgi:ABC-2 type transport system permease protein